jgi:hypothetical protein
MLILEDAENALARGDTHTALQDWNLVWSSQHGIPSMVGQSVAIYLPGRLALLLGGKPTEMKIQLSDFDVVSDKLGVQFSASKLAEAYNERVRQLGLNLMFAPPADLPSQFK